MVNYAFQVINESAIATLFDQVKHLFSSTRESIKSYIKGNNPLSMVVRKQDIESYLQSREEDKQYENDMYHFLIGLEQL
jgi:hypothetical protein